MSLIRLNTISQYQTMTKQGPQERLVAEETVVNTSIYKLAMTAKQPDDGPLPSGTYRAVFHAEGQPALDILVASPGVEVLYQTLGMDYPHDVPVFKGRVLELVGKFPLNVIPDEDPEPKPA